jgi:transcriptional regulator with XRE-family HTH domain
MHRQAALLASGVHDPRYRELIDELRRARIARGASQADFGAEIGRRQQFVSKYESGERRLDVVEFVDIARALKLPFDRMLKEIQATKP